MIKCVTHVPEQPLPMSPVYTPCRLAGGIHAAQHPINRTTPPAFAAILILPQPAPYHSLSNNMGSSFDDNLWTQTQVEAPQCFHTRNPFASGGIYEDPATGAATAAFAGYF